MHKPAVTQEELGAALERLLEGPERQRRLSARESSVGRRATGGEERITFADVAGVDDALVELSEVRDFLAEPERFAALGARVPSGVLFSGPPGCGKTLLARAVAGEANAAFFSVSGTDFVEVFVGEDAARVRDLFAEARAVAPAILFIDEIDAVGAQRSASSIGGHKERENTLNQILVELDGFESRTGVIVMAATNRPDMLDAALVRPGRFDRQVDITPPDERGRRAILALHAKGKSLAPDADLDVIAAVTQGFSGADLANVINEGALLAARERLPEITRAVLEEAIQRGLLGVASHRRIVSEEERRVDGDGPRRPGGRGDRFGDPGSGAADDLARVSATARQMVCQLGMSEALGGMTFGDNGAAGAPSYSEDTFRLIDAEVRRLVDEARARPPGADRLPARARSDRGGAARARDDLRRGARGADQGRPGGVLAPLGTRWRQPASRTCTCRRTGCGAQVWSGRSRAVCWRGGRSSRRPARLWAQCSEISDALTWR